jgi:hypothetical protein
MILRIPQSATHGETVNPPPDAGKVWVQVVCRYTPFGTGSFRGRAMQADLDRLFSGEGLPFLRLMDCYWYNEPDCEDEPWTSIGDFTRLGAGIYRNFTGEMCLRSETIEQIAVLKCGIEGEPTADL